MNFRSFENLGVSLSAKAQSQDEAPRLCYGAQTADSQPDCSGPDVQLVRVVSPEADNVPFITEWCSECRTEARHKQGATVEIIREVTDA